MASPSSSSPEVPCSVSVAGSMTLGAAHVEGSTLVWRPAADGVQGARVVDLRRVTGHQRNKPGSKRASLRLVLGAGASGRPDQKPEAFVLQFGKEPDRDALSERVKAAAATGTPSFKQDKQNKRGPSPAELAARAALLKSNPEVAAAHGRLVLGSRYAAADASADASLAAVDEEAFWGARGHLFADAVFKTGATQMTGISNALDADIKGARSGGPTGTLGGGDVVTATLSNEKMHRIFAERPAVRAAFLENVPRNMTEREFWTRFLRSEYFKAARAGAAPQGEQEAADLALFARRPETERARAATAKRVSAAVNLAADAGDFGVFGRAGGARAELGAVEGEGARGGHGIFRDGAKEPPPPSSAVAVAAAAGGGGGKAAAAKHAAMETLRSLNHHALVVLRGRPDAPVTDARSAALAAEAQEANELLTDSSKPNEHERSREAKDAVAAASVTLEDLVDATAAPPKTLRIDDPSRYFASVAEETTTPVLDTVSKKRRATPFEFGDAVARAAVAMRFERLANETAIPAATSNAIPAVDVVAARGVLDDLSSASRRAAAAAARGPWVSGGDLSAMDDVSDADKVALGSIAPEASRDAATAAELLRHFWTAAPLTSVARWEKASRVVRALGTLYDRMDARKKALLPGARHVLAQRSRPLVSAMDGAFSFFDDEKRTRRGAFEAFEKATKQGDAPDAPIEVS
jgi:transcription initiation factor TFIIH subunit 1